MPPIVVKPTTVTPAPDPAPSLFAKMAVAKLPEAGPRTTGDDPDLQQLVDKKDFGTVLSRIRDIINELA